MTYTESRAHGMACFEQAASSRSLTVFLHGLGLDADDFLAFMRAHPQQHAIALTLRGFEPGSSSVAPATFAEHAFAVAGLLADTCERHPDKEITLVGFSAGADLILRLAQDWSELRAPAPKLRSVLLLDPNVNHSTMTINKIFAAANPARPLDALKQLLALAPDLLVLEAICTYVARVARKDFRCIQRLAQDLVDYWEPAGYTQIGCRLNTVAAYAEKVRAVFSAPYAEKPAMIRKSMASPVDAGHPRLEVLEGVEHFDLIGETVLASQLKHVR